MSEPLRQEPRIIAEVDKLAARRLRETLMQSMRGRTLGLTHVEGIVPPETVSSIQFGVRFDVQSAEEETIVRQEVDTALKDIDTLSPFIGGNILYNVIGETHAQ